MKTKIEKFIDAACWIVVAAAAIYFITRIIVGLIIKTETLWMQIKS